jgi:hypothetical protein
MIRIEWMDGKVPALADGMEMQKLDGITVAVAGGEVETRVSEGVLHVYQYSGVVRSLMREWHLPTVNIRIWTKEK